MDVTLIPYYSNDRVAKEVRKKCSLPKPKVAETGFVVQQQMGWNPTHGCMGLYYNNNFYPGKHTRDYWVENVSYNPMQGKYDTSGNGEIRHKYRFADDEKKDEKKDNQGDIFGEEWAPFGSASNGNGNGKAKEPDDDKNEWADYIKDVKKKADELEKTYPKDIQLVRADGKYWLQYPKMKTFVEIDEENGIIINNIDGYWNDFVDNMGFDSKFYTIFETEKSETKTN